MPKMLDTDSDTDNQMGVDRLVPDSVSLASTQVGDDYDEFCRPRYILSPVTTVVHAVLDDVDGLTPDLVSLATTQVGNIDDYDEFRRPRDPVLPATTVVSVPTSGTSLLSLNSAGELKHGDQALSHNLSFAAIDVSVPTWITNSSSTPTTDHGWSISASSTLSTFDHYKAFDSNNFSTWWTSAENTYSATNGSALGFVTTGVDSGTVQGEYVEIRHATKYLLLTFFTLHSRIGIDIWPVQFKVLGSDNRSTWKTIYTQAPSVFTGTSQTWAIPAMTHGASYKIHRLVITQSVNIGQGKSCVGRWLPAFVEYPYTAKGLAAPVSASGAANKQYVDAQTSKNPLVSTVPRKPRSRSITLRRSKARISPSHRPQIPTRCRHSSSDGQSWDMSDYDGKNPANDRVLVLKGLRTPSIQIEGDKDYEEMQVVDVRLEGIGRSFAGQPVSLNAKYVRLRHSRDGLIEDNCIIMSQ
eukprot:g8695.t1